MKKYVKIISSILATSMLLPNIAYAGELVDTKAMTKSVSSAILYGVDKLRNAAVNTTSDESLEVVELEETPSPTESVEVELAEESATVLATDDEVDLESFVSEVYPEYLFFSDSVEGFKAEEIVDVQVDTFTGNAQVRQTDLSLKGKNGLDFELTRYYNSGQAYYSDVEYEDGDVIEKPTYNQKRLDIGMGWNFDIPSIETRKNKRYLHFGMKGTWELSESISGRAIGLEDYDFDDITLSESPQTGEYTVNTKDGKVYLFNDDGQLIEISNRFGDAISFSYDETGDNYLNTYEMTIIDTVGREIKIAQITEGSGSSKEIVAVEVEVTCPTEEKKKITYNVWQEDNDDGHAKLELDSVVGIDGEEISYLYEYKEMTWSISGSDLDMSVGYTLLTDIDMPTQVSRCLVYEEDSLKIRSNVTKDFFPVVERYDYDDDQYNIGEDEEICPIKYNHKIYSYVKSYSNKYLKCPYSTLHQYGVSTYRGESGVGSYLTRDATCTVIETTQGDSVIVYNAAGQVKREIACDNVVVTEGETAIIYGLQTYILTDYYSDSDASTVKNKHLLPKSKTTTIYRYNTEEDDYSEANKTTTEEEYVYDETDGISGYGDLIEYTYTDENENERTTSYTYLNRNETYSQANPYHIPIKETYTQNEGKIVTKTYILTEDMKNILSSEVYDFDGTTLKEKVGYTYNTDGTLQQSIIYNVVDGVASGELSKVTYSYTDNKGRTSVNNKSFDGLNVTSQTITNNKTVSNSGVVQTANESITESFVYDDYGNLIETTNAEGYTTKYEYDDKNRVTKVINPDDTTKRFEYIVNNDSNDIIQTDERGNKQRFYYDILGRLVYEKDPAANKILAAYEYDDNGKVVGIYDYVNSKSTYYTYDNRTNSPEVVETKSEEVWFDRNMPLTSDNSNTDVNWEYDEERYSQMLKKYEGVDSLTHTFKNLYNTITLNSGDYLFVDIDTVATVSVYVPVDGQEKLLTPANISTDTKLIFSASENAIAGKEIDGIRFEVTGNTDTDAKIYKTGIYRGNGGNILDTAGKTISKSEYFYEYQKGDVHTKATKIMYGDTDAEKIKEVYHFNSLGENTKLERYSGDTLMYTNTYEYDYAGNLLNKYTDDSATVPFTAYTYDYANRPVSVTNANGNTMYTSYDSAGRTATVTDFENNVTSYEYDSLGRKIKTEKMLREDYNLKMISISAYDKVGNITSSWMSNNAAANDITYDKISYEYNWRQQPTKVTSYTNNGSTAYSYVQYYYDEVGNAVRMYTGQNNPLTITGLDTISSGTVSAVTKYEYDYLNRLVKTTDPLGQVETYIPDYNGLVLTETDRNGNVITSDYDEFGRMLNITSTVTGGNADNHTYEYNMLGAVTKKDNVTYEYDNLGNMVKETNPDTNTVKEYQYDAFGNRTEFKLTINDVVQSHLKYTYNSVKLLDKIQDLLDNSSIIESYEYTPNGNLSKKTMHKTGMTVEYVNNNAGLVDKILVKDGDYVKYDYAYEYYANGNMVYRDEIVDYGDTKMTQYKYDGLGRLVTENTDGVTITYAYDKKGNRTSMKVTGLVDEPYTTYYSYDKNNRLVEEEKIYTSDYDEERTEYFYDPNGNMISKAKSTHTKSSAFITMSMLPSTVKGSGVYEYNGFNQLVRANESGTISTYTYDADGLRQSKTVAGVTTNHIWDGTNMVAETSGSGAVTNVYTRGMQLISMKSGNNVSYYIHNGHGDVTALMDASGNVTKEYAYDAFGVEQDIVSSDTNPFRYCGEYYDKESGNIYLRARYYSPLQGRFTTEDPIRDGLNWYAYCGGNPVVFVDSFGLKGVMLRYAIEKNKGSVTYDQTTGIATAKIGNTEKQYAGQIINGRMIVDSKTLAADFGMTEDAFMHKEKDFFNSEQDAALALALMYNPESINVTGDEVAAYIYKLDNQKGGCYYQFDGVVKGYTIDPNNRGVVLDPIDRINGRREVAWFHTHGPYTYDVNGNPLLGWNYFTDWNVRTDPITGTVTEWGDALYSSDSMGIGLNAYLANPAGELKYYDRSLYTPIQGNTHVSEPNNSVSIIASGIPTAL